MARMHDSQGNLIGGLNSIITSSAGHSGATPEAAAVAAYVPPHSTQPVTNRRYGAEEIVPGLECDYGTFAYLAAASPSRERSRLAGCRNLVEEPAQRHYCLSCGGSYCTAHAEAAAHDCTEVIQPR